MKQYIRIAPKHGGYMRNVKTLVLNKRGRVLKKIEKGDFVNIYVPPSHEKAQARRKKTKYVVKFRGPLKIVEMTSETTFKLASHFSLKKNPIDIFPT